MTDPTELVSRHECEAMWHLKKDGWTIKEIAFVLERREPTVIEHVNRDCHHHNERKGKFVPKHYALGD